MSALIESIRPLRVPLMTALAMAALAIAISFFAWGRHRDQLEAHRAIEQAARSRHAEVSELRRQLHNADVFAGAYQQLRDRGAIGRLDRPTALDRFESIARRFGPQVEAYTLGARSPQAAPGSESIASPGATHQLYRYAMAIGMKPIHEERLLTMLEQLATTDGPTTLLENCDLSRREKPTPAASPVSAATGSHPTSSTTAETTDATLEAHCVIAWYLFEPIDSAGEGSR